MGWDICGLSGQKTYLCIYYIGVDETYPATTCNMHIRGHTLEQTSIGLHRSSEK